MSSLREQRASAIGICSRVPTVDAGSTESKASVATRPCPRTPQLQSVNSELVYKRVREWLARLSLTFCTLHLSHALLGLPDIGTGIRVRHAMKSKAMA
jgi:hypothetical protein